MKPKKNWYEDYDPFKDGFEAMFKWVVKVLIIITILLAYSFIREGQYRKHRKESLETPPVWNTPGYPKPDNADIKLNYESRTITYVPHASPGQFSKPKSNKPYRGVEIRTGNTVINTGLTSEEILEQLDIDYNDVYDYYGIELR